MATDMATRRRRTPFDISESPKTAPVAARPTARQPRASWWSGAVVKRRSVCGYGLSSLRGGRTRSR